MSGGDAVEPRVQVHLLAGQDEAAQGIASLPRRRAEEMDHLGEAVETG